jgi:hypothetical protein
MHVSNLEFSSAFGTGKGAKKVPRTKRYIYKSVGLVFYHHMNLL